MRSGNPGADRGVEGHMMRRALLVLGMTAIVWPIGIGEAIACSCVGGTPMEFAESAREIFTGTVTEVRNAHPGEPISELAATFDVEEVYKGSVEDPVVVTTNSQGSACGYEFVVDRRYTVFTSGEADGVSTHLCTGTTGGAIDPAEFGLGAGPTEEPEPSASVEPEPTEAATPAIEPVVANSPASRSPWLVVGAVSIVLAALALVLRRGRA